MEPLFSNELLARVLRQAGGENSSNELLALLLRECYTSFSRNELVAPLDSGIVTQSHYGESVGSWS
jgi:hypothetical protein